MNLFSLTRPLLHALPPEAAHRVGLCALASGLVPAASPVADSRLAVNLAGLLLPNPIGLAAGFDKNAETLNHIFDHGFGFAECGTVTPLAQAGNPKPRIFRVPEHQAVINRLGFNNDGLEPFVERLKARKAAGIVGANIGKNKDSKDAVADYVTGAKATYTHADYLTVNISSPNTAGLRDLQEVAALRELIGAVQQVRADFIAKGEAKKPIFIKLAPDLSHAELEAIAALALELAVDGLILTNTTIARPTGFEAAHLKAGGLSGAPLFAPSTEILRQMARLTGGKLPLIGVGGIASGADAYAKIKAGASAVQLYTALIYQGLGLVVKVQHELLALLERDGFASLKEAIGAET